MTETDSKNKLVYPGTFLCYSEEFAPAENAFEDSDGKVYATAVGAEKESREKRSVGVAAPTKRLIKEHDLAYARVEDLYEKVALLSMQPASKRVASFNNFAYLRISEIKRGYAESFRDYLAIGDFIKARVVEVTPLGIYFSIAAPDLGVIKAFCSNCRNELKKHPKNSMLYCENCGSEESRKLALKLAPRAPGAPEERETREYREPRERREPRGDRGRW
ncbi:exosome complex RNA-binding protein Csl4 [Candidatus Micrarchaeota archaeon]|nr:exosome complex RNA-binding protein Csl4 [Candidatus Micrarchaeota archaeon]